MPDQPLRITVLLSGSGSTFAAIHEHSKQIDSHYMVTHVISDVTDAYGLTRARAAGCQTQCVDYSQFEDRHAFNRALLDAVEATTPQLVVLAGFMRIVDAEFVQAFEGKLLNIHPSLLPAYPGLNTYQRVLDAGDATHGSTVHFVNNVLDGGPAIAQAVVNVDQVDTPSTLATRVQFAERVLYPLVINWFADQRLVQREGAVWFDDIQQNNPLRGRVDETSKEFVHDDHL